MFLCILDSFIVFVFAHVRLASGIAGSFPTIVSSHCPTKNNVDDARIGQDFRKTVNHQNHTNRLTFGL